MLDYVGFRAVHVEMAVFTYQRDVTDTDCEHSVVWVSLITAVIVEKRIRPAFEMSIYVCCFFCFMYFFKYTFGICYEVVLLSDA